MRLHQLALLALVAGCGQPPPPVPTSGAAVDGVEELDQPLADLTAECTYSAAGKTLALALTAGDVAVISREVNDAITVNGYRCGAASTSTVNRIDVSGSTGDETVIVDLRGGRFTPGSAGHVGIFVDLGGGTGDALKLIGTPGVDNVVYGASGIALDGDPNADIGSANVELFTVSLIEGGDTFSGAGNTATGAAFPLALEVYGGDDNDSLRGGAGADTLHGGAGDDTFVGGDAPDGGDTLLGDTGTDTADYSSRRTAITVSLDDVANDGGNAEGDNVTTSVEIVKGGLGDDILTGGPGNDTLYGGPGNDRITGGPGNDHLYGDSGDDMFDEGATASGADVISGGAGTDAVAYVMRTQPVTVTLDGVADSGATAEADQVMSDVEIVIGGAADDTIVGSASANALYGGGGNDHLSGGAGDDVLVGGPGNDTLNGDADNDRFDEGAVKNGDDTLIGGAGIDTADYTARTHDLVIAMDGITAGAEPRPSPAARFGALVADAPLGGGPVLARQVLAATNAPTVAQSRIIYLNHNGVTVHPGVNDSRTNASSIASSLTALPGWTTSDTNWNATVACLADMYKRWDLVVTDQDPGSVSHIEAVFTRAPASLGLPSNVAGVSPFTLDCANIDNSIVYTFTDLLGNNPQLICEVMAQEIAHSYGLDHEMLASDPMTYLPRTGNRSFQDQTVSCGEFSPRPCGINGSTCRANQNSVAELTSRIGLASNSSDFKIALGSTAVALAPGAAVTVAITSSLAAGSADTLALAAVDLPAGVTATFGTASITAGASTTLTLTAAAGASAGGAVISITATAGSRTRAAHGAVAVVTAGWATDADRISTDVENLYAGSGNDTITGNGADNVIDGGPGNDTINGGAGDDTIDGGSGNDTIDCGTGDADIDLDPTSTASHCEL